MAAAPRPGATLLLLLSLLQPPPASGNEGGAVGGCRCQTLRGAPGDPTALAQKVLSYRACPGYLVRFQLPHRQICGLKNAAWVIRLQELLEQKEAAQIDARQGEKGSGSALNPTNALLPPNTNPPMLSTARLTVPQGPTNGPLKPHGHTNRPLVPHGHTDGTPEPHRPTDGLPELHGPTDGHWEPYRRTDGPLEPHGPTTRPTDGALSSDPVRGLSVAPRQGEGAGDGAPPAQLHPSATVVLALLVIVLGLVGAVTYLLCHRRRGAQCGGAGRGSPQGPCTPHRDPGSGMLYRPVSWADGRCHPLAASMDGPPRPSTPRPDPPCCFLGGG